MKTVWQLLMKKKISIIKESNRKMNNQRSYTEKIDLIEELEKMALMRLLNTMKLLAKVQSLKYKTCHIIV